MRARGHERARNVPLSITQKDIARKLKLSQGAISHVLNGREHFLHPTTAQRIRKALSDAKYRPDRAARGLRCNRSGIIGIIVPNLRHPVFSEKAQEIHRLAQRDGYQVMIGDADERIENEAKFIQDYRAFHADGLIVMGSFNPVDRHARYLEQTAASGIPLVTVDGPLGIDCPAVNTDSAAGMRAGVAHLLSLGHRRVAYAGYDAKRDSTKRRWPGVRSAYLDERVAAPVAADLFPPSQMIPQRSFAAGYDVARSVLTARARQTRAEKYTAIACFNDFMAIGVMRYLRDRGLHIPGDLSVIGFDGFDAAAVCVPRLTTLDQPKAQAAALAFQLLRDLIDRRSSVPTTHWLAPKLMVGDSTGPVSRSSLAS